MADDPVVEWRPVAEVPAYQVSAQGEVRGLRGHTMALRKNGGGYMTVSLFVGDRKTLYRQVHRLVALEFIPNPDGRPLVNHIDGDRTNNAVANLEWVTHKENANKTVNPSTTNRRRARAVAELAADGSVAREWGSVKEAAAALGVSANTVAARIKSEKHPHLRFACDLDVRTDEVWAALEEFGGEVSDHGRIRTEKGEIVVGRNRNGYLYFRTRGVHILVARAFCPNPENKPVVGHIDGKPTNNRADNLRWTTQQENSAHAHAAGFCHRRPVRYLDPDGKSQDFETIKAACEATGAHAPDISRACRTGRVLARGRRWFYMAAVIDPKNRLSDAEVGALLEWLSA